MRLWHKDLIHVLPKQQLIAQWRECCCIAKNIADKGTPNHLLVNKILDYPPIHFEVYCHLVEGEMLRRGYKVTDNVRHTLESNIRKADEKNIFNRDKTGILYDDWHNSRYFWQCYYNLQEKYDCGGISKEEWAKIKIVTRYMDGCGKYK